MVRETHEIKKITAGLIFSWIFGVLFLLTGVGVIGTGGYISGIIIILCSAMIIPYFDHLIKEKFHIEISGGVKWILVIIIFVAMGFGMSNSTKDIQQSTQVDQSKVETVVGQDSSVNQKVVQNVPSTPTLNKKTEYIKTYLKLEDVEVSEQNTYFGRQKIVSGKIRNTGDKSLDSVDITIYYLDSSNKRIGEKTHYPIYVGSIMGDQTPLKPNYVRDWSYSVSEEAPSGWAKKVEVVIADITFSEE